MTVVLTVATVALAPAASAADYISVNGAPPPPKCQSVMQKKYEVGLAPNLSLTGRGLRPGVAVTLTEHRWYNPRPFRHPRTNALLGYNFAYSVRVIGEQVSMPYLIGGGRVLCRR